jgi:hypothetical protein
VVVVQILSQLLTERFIPLVVVSAEHCLLKQCLLDFLREIAPALKHGLS